MQPCSPVCFSFLWLLKVWKIVQMTSGPFSTNAKKKLDISFVSTETPVDFVRLKSKVSYCHIEAFRKQYSLYLRISVCTVCVYLWLTLNVDLFHVVWVGKVSFSFNRSDSSTIERLGYIGDTNGTFGFENKHAVCLSQKHGIWDYTVWVSITISWQCRGINCKVNFACWHSFPNPSRCCLQYLTENLHLKQTKRVVFQFKNRKLALPWEDLSWLNVCFGVSQQVLRHMCRKVID